MLFSERENPLLKNIEKEAGDQKRKHEEQDVSPHFFELAKELTLCYFTSEIGATQALSYIQTPGKYDGCASSVPYLNIKYLHEKYEKYSRFYPEKSPLLTEFLLFYSKRYKLG